MKELSYFEKSEEIYTPFERLEMENEKLREDIESLKNYEIPFKIIEKSFTNKKLDELCGLISHIEKRLFDLETYIHGPTRKPYDWEEK